MGGSKFPSTFDKRHGHSWARTSNPTEKQIHDNDKYTCKIFQGTTNSWQSKLSSNDDRIIVKCTHLTDSRKTFYAKQIPSDKVVDAVSTYNPDPQPAAPAPWYEQTQKQKQEQKIKKQEQKINILRAYLSNINKNGNDVTITLKDEKAQEFEKLNIVNKSNEIKAIITELYDYYNHVHYNIKVYNVNTKKHEDTLAEGAYDIIGEVYEYARTHLTHDGNSINLVEFLQICCGVKKI